MIKFDQIEGPICRSDRELRARWLATPQQSVRDASYGSEYRHRYLPACGRNWSNGTSLHHPRATECLLLEAHLTECTVSRPRFAVTRFQVELLEYSYSVCDDFRSLCKHVHKKKSIRWVHVTVFWWFLGQFLERFFRTFFEMWKELQSCF
jgi:hypothetical protein